MCKGTAAISPSKPAGTPSKASAKEEAPAAKVEVQGNAFLAKYPYWARVMMLTVCLHSCFLIYGVIQELLVTRDGIASSTALVFSNRVAGMILATCILTYQGKPLRPAGVPLYKFACFSMSNDVSTWASYEMLKYVSFPCQVLAKTCKLVPVMIMGTLLNGQKFSRAEYTQGFVLMLAMSAMVYSTQEDKHVPDFALYKLHIEQATWDSIFDTICNSGQYAAGAAFLGLYYACDSFTSNWQSRLYKEHKSISEHQMMFCGNVCAIIFLAGSAIVQPGPIIKTYEMLANDDGSLIMRIAILSLCAAIGQNWIYFTIKELGPLVFTSIMTLRQIFSVFISIVWFGHRCTPMTIACIVVVFAVVVSRQVCRARATYMKRSVAGKEKKEQ